VPGVLNAAHVGFSIRSLIPFTRVRRFDEFGFKAQLDPADNQAWSRGVMSVRDLIKATVFCGLSAFFVYSYPALGQAVLIGGLCLLWLSYAFTVIRAYRR
jgi:hypothetical protein